MKKIYTLVLLLGVLSGGAQSGITWSTPVPVAMSNYSNMHPRVAVDAAGNALVLWGKQSGMQTNFSKWMGGGFITPTVVSAGLPVFTDSWAGPDLEAKGDMVYAVFKTTPEDTGHIYTVVSMDGGITFAPPVVVDNNLGDSVSRFPTVAVDAGGHPLVGFMKFDAGFMRPRYVVARSNNYGASYGTDVLAGEYSGGEACDCCPASLAVNGDTVAIMYRDNLNNIRNMWAGVSTNNGNTFPSGLQMDNSNWFINTCPSSGPDGVIIGDTLYSVYMSQGSGTKYIYLSRSSLSTSQSDGGVLLTGPMVGLISQNYPRIANKGKSVAAVWRQRRSNMDQVVVMFARDVTKDTLSYETVSMGQLLINADVAVSDSTIHVVWQDDNAGVVMYRRGIFVPDTLSIPTGVEKANEMMRVSVYPNPTSNGWIVKGKVESARLYDAKGSVIEIPVASREDDTMQINSGSFAKGVYVLKLESEGRTKIVRMVKE